MSQNDLYVLIGKQAAVIENYKDLLEKAQDWYYYSEDQLHAMKKAQEFAQEILN
jgi:hypothetical protein